MHIKNRHNKNKGAEMARYRPPAKMINTWTKLVESLVTSRSGWVGVMDVMVRREKNVGWSWDGYLDMGGVMMQPRQQKKATKIFEKKKFSFDSGLRDDCPG